MNANELADELENTYPFVGVMEIAATMLRHQQALIKQLEKTQDYLYKTHDADKAEIDALRNQLWDLKSEPWGFDRTASHMAGEYVSYPVKELTDEEILDLCPPNHSDMMNEAYTIDFARAILRKASEK